MSGEPSFFRRHRSKLLIGLVAVLVLGVGGPWLYINVIEGDPPKELAVEDASDCSAGVAADAVEDSTDVIDGTWTVGTGSTAGYRVGETLLGQRATATGRTSAVTSELTIAGDQITAVTATVDMTQVSSDKAQRDGQFQNRIMSTSQFPTATFTMTSPITLGSVPAECQKITAEATGDLTLRGQTQAVVAELTALRQDGTLVVNGTIDVSFDNFQIPDAAGGPAASVDRDGTIELLLVYSKA